MNKKKAIKNKVQTNKNTPNIPMKNIEDPGLLFHRKNYILILTGIFFIALGYILMSGGSMPDYNTWDDSIIYSFRRTVVAPILILIGLGIEIYAIFKK